MPKVNEALEDFAEAKPYLRSAVAFVLLLRYGGSSEATVARYFTIADLFIVQLEKDLAAE